MPIRSFDEDAAQAVATTLPVPRGIAFRYKAADGRPRTAAQVKRAAGKVLHGWDVCAVVGMAGWFEAIPPEIEAPGVAPRAIPLSEFWTTFRMLDDLDEVEDADPLMLIVVPQPEDATAAEAFAATVHREELGLWGLPQPYTVQQRIDQAICDCVRHQKSCDWHLCQMNVGQAWELWRARHGEGEPGAGVVVGHPDTGYTEHHEVRSRLNVPGKSFLRDPQGKEPNTAVDDLRVVHNKFLETPGHGTGTACVIVSGGSDRSSALPAVEPPEAHGVAPGARILPLRVSRSVLHLDFGNLARAIAYAADAGVDVISMSLGGPWYSDFVRESIDRAHEKGVIIVAAAGNYLPSTAFPAALPEVIGVSATNVAETPWRFSGIGRLVDIAAPGEELWRARAELDKDGKLLRTVTAASGTSFATACIAGLAALWVSYHGRDAIAAKYDGEQRLIPFAFQYLLSQTARTPVDKENKNLSWVAGGKHGAGIADAAKLLGTPLPERADVEAFEAKIRGQRINKLTFFAGLLSGGMGITAAEPDTPPAAEPDRFALAAQESAAQEAKLREFLTATSDEPPEEKPEDLLLELMPLIATDRVLMAGFGRWRKGESRLPLLDRLLGLPSLTTTLQKQLTKVRNMEISALPEIHKGALAPGVSLKLPDPKTAGGASPSQPPTPAYRELRAYSFDPSLSTVLETAPIFQVTIPTRWEDVEPGPKGEYLEVIDVDPASGCVYSPVDLNHPYLTVRDGLPPSEGNPQFHQQMVYAVAMNTIHRFELALGRPVFWSPLLPWSKDHPEEKDLFTREAIEIYQTSLSPDGRTDRDGKPQWYDPLQTRYVQRLRVYPHALREPNAFYSPTKRALLFGYFPSEDDTGREYPGGTVFTCLSHDIIAHETTHALVDGMHPYFNEPSNNDVWAFHEAFADIMALFQHFTYAEVLRHQIAQSRGDLETDNLLGQLAQQFGQAIGQRGALRDYLGKKDEAGVWQRTKPDPRALESTVEPHERGSILVAAVFDAFLILYNDRVRDLLRISTGGTGVLQPGQIHPDLANRLANEAALTADEVLRVCIRAMDYLPPIDVTFGEFLRAMITADYDLAPVLRRRNRVAFIEAFRAWGIYPRDVNTLSEDSLRWRGVEADSLLASKLRDIRDKVVSGRDEVAELIAALERWQPGCGRDEVFRKSFAAQRRLHGALVGMQPDNVLSTRVIPGLDLRKGASISVGNLRPARRIGPQGEFRTEMIVEVVQTDRRSREGAAPGWPLRGGATLIVDLSTWEIRYIISKGLYRKLPKSTDPGQKDDPGELTNRLKRQLGFAERSALWQGEATVNTAGRLAGTYGISARHRRVAVGEPFALLHRGF